MRTQKQIEASRRNGAKSRGPKTPRARQPDIGDASSGMPRSDVPERSASDRARHALLAASVVLPSEARSGFRSLLNQLYDELQPVTPIECQFVEVMAVCHWRRMRLWCLEMGQLAHALFAQQRIDDPLLDSEAGQIPVMPTAVAFGKLSSDNRTLGLMHRYESHFGREYRRTLREFKDHRSERLARESLDRESLARESQARKSPADARLSGEYITQENEIAKSIEPRNAEVTPEERDNA
jgi:hypothetical protein